VIAGFLTVFFDSAASLHSVPFSILLRISSQASSEIFATISVAGLGNVVGFALDAVVLAAFANWRNGSPTRSSSFLAS
jgi:hypothetical protein